MSVCFLSSAKQYRQFDFFHLQIQYRTCNDASAFNCWSQLYIAYIFPIHGEYSSTQIWTVLEHFYLGKPPTMFDNPNTIDICVNTKHSNGTFYYAIKYDLYRHIPLYAAYQVNSFSGKVRRPSTWHVETDLLKKTTAQHLLSGEF